MIINIVRHAETYSNSEGRLQGSDDILPSKEGLINYLDTDYDIIFCSSMKKTQQTLAIALGRSIGTRSLKNPQSLVITRIN